MNRLEVHGDGPSSISRRSLATMGSGTNDTMRIRHEATPYIEVQKSNAVEPNKLQSGPSTASLSALCHPPFFWSHTSLALGMYP